MSELTEYLGALATVYNGEDSTARHVLRFLPQHDAEIVAEAKREQMEDDCKATCRWCNSGVPMSRIWPDCHENIPDISGELLTGAEPCRAYWIRTAFAKAQKEAKRG